MKKNSMLKIYVYNSSLCRNGAYNNVTSIATSFNKFDGINKKFQKWYNTSGGTGGSRRFSSSFNLFDKIKDVNKSNSSEEGNEENDMKKRKPSKKVLKLVDEILNLTLIEAADLCDICQEKLDGNKQFNNSFFVNRNPFPHPSSFFAAGNFPPPNVNMSMNAAYPIQGNAPSGSQETTAQSSKAQNEQSESKKKEEKKNTKTTFNVKLEKFDVKNKINTIKEIRKITNVGLKEAKDMVESAPFYIQKSVPAEKADEMKKRFEELGATIILE
ncbi:50S ribosomal protein L7/L12 [Plasmodium gonderi]|uniref:50S ribosomal protein L7/L12 n=1 Tax=Plasmodium gonderi TaxID=77519 RepID=A0A1Y1JE40_PLAGO|nr:50S ribosomal protein L7/L12 [Plasmodium gonderi]GAW79487.1 50S ribosomal protein L7/L12 [Plasmodium gonderi]